MPKHLDQIAAASAEDVEIASMGISAKCFLDLKRQPVHAAAHVGHASREPHPNARREPGSSAVHNLEHPRERRRVYPRINDDPTPAPDARSPCVLSGPPRFSAPPRGRSPPARTPAPRLRAPTRSGPNARRHVRQQDGEIPYRRAVADTSRGPLQALHDNPELLVLRPASASTRLHHLEPPDLRTVRMTVHTHSPQPKQLNPARRPSAEGYRRTSGRAGRTRGAPSTGVRSE